MGSYLTYTPPINKYQDGDLPRTRIGFLDAGGVGYAYYRASELGHCKKCQNITYMWYVDIKHGGNWICEPCNNKNRAGSQSELIVDDLFNKEGKNNPKVWYWFDNENKEWIRASEQISIEEEYQEHLSGKRVGQRTYCCFGDKSSSSIDFDEMTTECASAHCHKSDEIKNDHVTHKLKRE